MHMGWILYAPHSSTLQTRIHQTGQRAHGDLNEWMFIPMHSEYKTSTSARDTGTKHVPGQYATDWEAVALPAVLLTAAASLSLHCSRPTVQGPRGRQPTTAQSHSQGQSTSWSQPAKSLTFWTAATELVCPLSHHTAWNTRCVPCKRDYYNTVSHTGKEGPPKAQPKIRAGIKASRTFSPTTSRPSVVSSQPAQTLLKSKLPGHREFVPSTLVNLIFIIPGEQAILLQEGCTSLHHYSKEKKAPYP